MMLLPVCGSEVAYGCNSSKKDGIDQVDILVTMNGAQTWSHEFEIPATTKKLVVQANFPNEEHWRTWKCSQQGSLKPLIPLSQRIAREKIILSVVGYSSETLRLKVEVV